VEASPFEVVRPLAGGGSVTLSGEEVGSGPPVVLMHGLSATRRNVVQGSKLLPRGGYRVVSYDARGHGASSPAPGDYGYSSLVEDLWAVMDDRGIDRAALVGSSMGAATAVAAALERPERVAALVLITPAYAGTPGDEGRWEKLAGALETGGVDGFVDATAPETLPERWREALRLAVAQRMERHEHPGAVAEALRAVPRSSAWEGMEPLRRLSAPTLIVASRDEADPTHARALADEYARLIPGAELVVEDEGQAPLAWQGGRLSQAVTGFLRRVGYS
jgi:pimeloyl-ACP methyl ester carboxylesterase